MTRRERNELAQLQKRAALVYASRGCSQQDLAEEFGVSQSTMSRYIKFGGLAILAECGIKEHDGPETIKTKAHKAGYHDTKDVLSVYQNCMRV